MARKKANISPKTEKGPAAAKGRPDAEGHSRPEGLPLLEGGERNARRKSVSRAGSGALDLGIGGGLARIEGEKLFAQASG